MLMLKPLLTEAANERVATAARAAEVIQRQVQKFVSLHGETVKGAISTGRNDLQLLYTSINFIVTELNKVNH